MDANVDLAIFLEAEGLNGKSEPRVLLQDKVVNAGESAGQQQQHSRKAPHGIGFSFSTAEHDSTKSGACARALEESEFLDVGFRFRFYSSVRFIALRFNSVLGTLSSHYY
jgi:hypothetical protein